MTQTHDRGATRSRRVRRASRIALAGVAGAGLLFTAACSSDSESAGDGASEATEGAARMAFAYGFSGGGPEAEFIAGLNCYAERNGLSDVTVTYADGDSSKQITDFDSLIARASEIDGIFTIQVDPASAAPAVKAAQDAGIVVIDPIGKGPDGEFLTESDSHVSPDDAGLPKLIVDGIVADQPDAETIVLLSPPPGQAMTDARAAGVTEVAEDAGLEVVANLSVENMTTENAQQAFEDLLARDPDIDVVFAQNGAMARGAALAAKSQDVDVAIYSLDADDETIAAVQSGDITATYGADLFQVAVLGSEEVESIMAGNAAEPATVAYVRYDKDNSEVVPISERCDAN